MEAISVEIVEQAIAVEIATQSIDVVITGGATWNGVSGKPTAVAESSFMVSGASPFAWLVKTLAQVKTILGLGDKVDKVTGSSLVADTEIAKIHASGSDAETVTTISALQVDEIDFSLINSYRI
jgi:hypothetical protein